MEPADNETEVWISGRSFVARAMISDPILCASTACNVSAESTTLKRVPLASKDSSSLSHCCVLYEPLLYDFDGSRTLLVRVLEVVSHPEEGLTLGLLPVLRPPDMRSAEVCDEAGDGLVAWGFSGLVLKNGDFMESSFNPRSLKAGDEVGLTLDLVGAVNLLVNGKKIVELQKSEDGSAMQRVWGVLDLMGGVKQVELMRNFQLDPTPLALRVTSPSLILLAANGVGFARPEIPPEGRTFLSVAPLPRVSPEILASYSLTVLSAHCKPTDAEGLTIGLAWTPGNLEISTPIDSPDLVPSEKLWLVGFDGQFFAGGLDEEGLWNACNWHGRDVRPGDKISVEVRVGGLVILKNGETVVDLEISTPSNGHWWAVGDLMGSCEAVAAFAVMKGSAVIEEESIPLDVVGRSEDDVQDHFTKSEILDGEKKLEEIESGEKENVESREIFESRDEFSDQSLPPAQEPEKISERGNRKEETITPVSDLEISPQKTVRSKKYEYRNEDPVADKVFETPKVEPVKPSSPVHDAEKGMIGRAAAAVRQAFVSEHQHESPSSSRKSLVCTQSFSTVTMPTRLQISQSSQTMDMEISSEISSDVSSSIPSDGEYRAPPVGSVRVSRLY